MKLKCCGYNIIVGLDILKNIGENVNFSQYSKVIVLTEKKIYNLWKDKINSAIKFDKIIQVDSGEKTKSLETAKDILRQLIDVGADRKSLLINVGGGMITDLGGFVASIYMRGIEYINCPTTLLAMVDASIGGKNGVNFEEIKNIVGCFGHPKMVLIDIDFLKTLKKREYISAYGEIIKHSIIFDKKYFNMLKKNLKTGFNANDAENDSLLKIIYKSLKIKKHIVEKDFKEKNIRKLLNFGHTIGHAIEALSLETKQPLLHGEAVAVGMIVESKIAIKIGMFSKQNFEEIYSMIEQYGFEKIVKAKFGFSVDDVLKVIKKDKKNKNGKIKMVLPVKIGKCKHDIDIEPRIIKSCLRDILDESGG